MAGDWGKIEHGLRDKPEVIAMAAELNVPDRDLIVGKLIRLWEWFNKNTADGCAHGVTQTFIDSHVALEGFATALETVGWLSVRNGSICQPNFDRHNSKSAKARALANERVKRSRNVASVTKPLPEKRREEKKETPLPPSLDTPEFRKEWDDYRRHRAEIKKPIKPTGEKKALAKLERMGLPRALISLRESMANGWTGVFEPKDVPQAEVAMARPLTDDEFHTWNPVTGEN